MENILAFSWLLVIKYLTKKYTGNILQMYFYFSENHTSRQIQHNEQLEKIN